MSNDSISTATASAVLALYVGREVEIRGEFGAFKVVDKQQVLTGGGITEVMLDEADDLGHIVVRLEFATVAVEIQDNPDGTLFEFSPGGLWCSMGAGEVTISLLAQA